jgi:4-carboxymuconolactone decarboxylase
MTRIAMLSREDLGDDEQRRIWDRIAASRPRMGGPFNVLMRTPEVAERVFALYDYFGHEASLDAGESEFACLVVARRIRSRHLWVRHVPSGLDAGLTTEIIDAVRAQDLSTLSPRLQLIAELVDAVVVAGGHLTDDRFAELDEEFGTDAIQFATLASMYLMLGALLNMHRLGADMDEAGFE